MLIESLLTPKLQKKKKRRGSQRTTGKLFVAVAASTRKLLVLVAGLLGRPFLTGLRTSLFPSVLSDQPETSQSPLTKYCRCWHGKGMFGLERALWCVFSVHERTCSVYLLCHKK